MPKRKSKSKCDVFFNGVHLGETDNFFSKPEPERRTWSLWWWDKHTQAWVNCAWEDFHPPEIFAINDIQRSTPKDFYEYQTCAEDSSESVSRRELPLVHKHYQSASAYYKDYNDCHSDSQTAK